MIRLLERLLEDPTIYLINQKLIFSRASKKIAQVLRTELPQHPDCRLLDVGCGSQGHAALVEGDYTGVDLNPAYIEYCSRRYPGRYLTMDATRLAFEDASFDAVFSVGLCHHLSREQNQRGLAEWIRVLRPNGTLLLLDAILPLDRWNLPGWILRKMDRGGYVLPWQTWQEMFRESGAPDARFSTDSSFPYDFAILKLRRS